MKYFFALCCFLASTLVMPALDAAEWLTDFEKAKDESLKTKRPIYILFTNSDAAPDRSLDRTIFSQRKFHEYADKKLVLMKVDFPNAVHLQPKSLSQQNRELRIEYGISILPTALLLDSNGIIYVDFLKADGSQEKHRRKMNEIMDFDPPKRYTEYLDGFVKKYTPPALEVKKTEAKADAKKPDEKKTATAKPAATKKPDKKPAEKKPATVSADTNIPDENAGIPKIPLNPEGDIQEWLKSSQAEEAAPAKADDDAKSAAKDAGKAKADKDAKTASEPAKEQASAPAEQ